MGVELFRPSICLYFLMFVAIASIQYERNRWFRSLAFAVGWKASVAKLPSVGLWLNASKPESMLERGNRSSPRFSGWSFVFPKERNVFANQEGRQKALLTLCLGVVKMIQDKCRHLCVSTWFLILAFSSLYFLNGSQGGSCLGHQLFGGLDTWSD